MDRLHRVFVSSTYEDLKEERREIMKALLELDCIPSGMELFPADDQESWELIKSAIEACDYYIVVIAGKYGSVDSDGMSYTEKEYKHALEKEIPILGFLHENPDSIPYVHSEQDPEKKRKLEIFSDFVKNKNCKKWNTAAELGGVVSRSLLQIKKSRPRPGWIRADNVVADSALKDMIDLKNENENLKKEVEDLKLSPPDSARNLASGDEIISVLCEWQEYNYVPTEFGPRPEVVQRREEYKMTWDAIFKSIAPMMLRGSADEYVKIEMGKRMAEIYNIPAFGSIASLSPTAWDTIKIQFLALGLVKISRWDGDVLYWQLTPLGERKMMELCAVKSNKSAL